MAGEEFPNVMNGVDYLFLANAGKETNTKGDVIVVGGGNVAIDVARTAIRKGAKSVKLYCLESKEEMPAASDEQIEAKDEGITIHNGWGPMVIENDGKNATGITFKKCTSVIDENGKFNPSYDESVTEKVEAQTIILSIGQKIDWGNLLEGTKVETGRGNAAVVKELSFQTAEEDIFAGGDVVTGPRFAIDAIAAGKEGAHSIFRYLTGRHLTNGRNYEYKAIKLDRVNVNINRIDLTPRQYAPEVDHAKAIQTWNDLREGLTEDQIAAESGRCLHCGRSVVDLDKCIGCGVCIHRCEFDAIKLTRVDDTQSAANMKNWYGRLAKNVVKRGANIALTSVRERLGGDETDA
ncbi:MAG: FAD-dependent oxidoreductase [Clostridia bacterium]|nr:FAD-dependent oxidoreductase [Clostridia bacterium]